MPDLDEQIRREAEWIKYGTLPAGGRILIQINTGSGLQTVLDKTLPANREFKYAMIVKGDLKAV